MTNRLWELLGLYWRNELSTTEKAELEQLLLEHPDAWLKAGLMDQLSFKKAPVMDEAAAESWAGQMAERIAAMEEPPPPPPKKRSAPKVWLGVCCLLLIAGSIYLYRAAQGSGLKVVATDAGMKTRIRLSDGTMLWLNAGSTVKYPQRFTGAVREIFLSGEAYFDVTKDAGRPFIIHTDKMDIRVLGTTFNVRSYDDEGFSETALISGAVEVEVREADSIRKVILKPNEKLVVSELAGTVTGNKAPATAKKQTIIEQKQISLVPSRDSGLVVETAWLSNQLIFQNETLESISRRLERWYGAKITIESPNLAAMRFSGRADNLTLEKLLSVLKEIQAFDYAIQGDSVIIK